jgi:hypothetical protein
MTAAPDRLALAASLAELAATCEEAVARYTSGARRAPGRRFSEHVGLALGSLRACVEQPKLHDDDLRLLLSGCADAAAACRAEPVCNEARAAAAAFDRAAATCSDALGNDIAEAGLVRASTRFLFEDADFATHRAGRRWQVRKAGSEAEAARLDEAIAELFPTLSNTRLAELTVHILEWSADA